MSMLPPVGWADVATKQDIVAVRADLDHLRTDLGKDMTLLEDRLIAQLHREINRQIWSMFGFLTAGAAILTANNIL